MAGKKFDLGSYKTDTNKTQVKHNKYSAFLENEDDSTEDSSLNKGTAQLPEKEILSVKKSPEKKNPTDKKKSAPISEPEKLPEAVTPTADVSSSESCTPKRINMAFTDANYKLISEESERLSVSFVYFINSLIRIVDEKDISRYIESMTIRRSKDNISRRKGKPAKRINLKFSPELHSMLSRGAASCNMTITQYMNTIIEVYAVSARSGG